MRAFFIVLLMSVVFTVHGQDKSTMIQRPDFMQYIWLSSNVSKYCTCYDLNKNYARELEAIDSCSTVIEHRITNQQERSTLLLATYKKMQGHWATEEYGFNGEKVDSYDLVRDKKGWRTLRDTVYIENADTGEFEEVITDYYQMLRE